MRNSTGLNRFAGLSRGAVLILAAAGLAGCVYYPSGYGYGRSAGYYAAPAVTVVPPPVVVGGWWGGWGGDDD